MALNFDKIKLPKTISPCPIIEAVVEIRFESQFPYDAIFGIVYNGFKKDYPNVKELPILQLPGSLRRQEPDLQYKPYYQLYQDDKFLFQVGARVISLISINPYVGWSTFSTKLKDILGKVKKLEIVNSYVRVGIRYINGFDFDIFKKINLSLNMIDENLIGFNTNMRVEIPMRGFISNLRILNSSNIEEKAAKKSRIDIDTFIKNPKGEILDIIEKGHLEEKKLFFTLLQKDFIEKELNPEY